MSIFRILSVRRGLKPHAEMNLAAEFRQLLLDFVQRSLAKIAKFEETVFRILNEIPNGMNAAGGIDQSAVSDQSNHIPAPVCPSLSRL